MKKRSLALTSFFALIGITAFIAALSFYLGTSHMQSAHAEQPPALLTLTPNDVIQGERSAPVTIIEYSSLSCPHCAAFHEKVLPALKEKYIDTGKAVFTNRQFPLNAPALRAAMLTKCVGPEREATFTGVLFDMQETWAFSEDYEDQLKKLSAVGGVTPEEFDACMKNSEIENALLEGRQQASDILKVASTPTFFINGEEVKGTLSVERFEELIDSALAKP